MCESRRTARFKSYGRGVWVPAFAGTTACYGSYDPFVTTSAIFLSLGFTIRTLSWVMA